MRWFERRRLITLYYKCPDGLSDALTRRGFRPETLKTSSRQCGAYPDGAKTASMGPDAAPRITPRIGTRPGIFAHAAEQPVRACGQFEPARLRLRGVASAAALRADAAAPNRLDVPKGSVGPTRQ